MRLKQIALATLFGAVLALPAMAQTTTVAPTKSSTPAPATPATPATPPTTTAKPTTTTAATTPKVVGPVNINTATATELRTLPGIGKARSAAIIKGRPYKAVDDIDTKKIIPHAEYDKVKASLTM